MKIEGPNSTRSTSSSQRKGKTEGGGAFGGLLSGGTDETEAASTTHSIAHIDTLLAVQEAEDPAERAARKRMKARADSILDELEDMRMALLTGTLTVGHVIDIADVVAQHRERIMDPRLTALLDEIDLRAQIELAKLRRAINGPKTAAF